jgi:hypothetical protein
MRRVKTKIKTNSPPAAGWARTKNKAEHALGFIFNLC